MRDALPKGWVQVCVGDICTDPQYGWTTKAADTGTAHLLRTTDITSGTIDWDTVPYCSEVPADVNKYQLKDGDIVISRAGSVGFSILVKEPPSSVFASYLIRFLPLIDKRYVADFLLSPSYWRAISDCSSGIALANVNATKLKAISLPLPPLPEQKRIVTKIEELFSDLDAGVGELKKAQAQLKRYRQSVLKAAFEGKLTEKWRNANKGKLEPASILLERIREERKKKTEKEGKRFKESEAVDTSGLPELPDGWAWARLSQLVSAERHSVKRGPFGSAIKKSFFVPQGFKVYEQQNAIYDDHRLGNYYIDAQKFEELQGFEVKQGDFIVSCSGTIGRISQLPDQAEKGVINQALLKLTMDSHVIMSQFFLYVFRSEPFQGKILTETRGSAMKNIASVDDIKSIPIALPCIVEQSQILAEIESRFTLADKAEEIITQSLKQAQRLRQSILKRAFEGKLVPQDPKDEPAEKLLERIKAEKAKQETNRHSKISARGRRGRKPRHDQ